MVVQLEDYLRNQMPARKSEIEQIGETAAAVLESFHLAFDNNRNAWPYRIDRRKPPAAAHDYSFSTNSMVLFALKALLGDYEPSVVSIGSSQPSLRLGEWARSPLDPDARAPRSRPNRTPFGQGS